MKPIITLLLTISLYSASAQDTLCGWQFPTGTADDSIANIAIAANENSAIRAESGTSAINYSTNGVTNYCAQATGWDNGANTKFWSIRFYTTGYYHLKLSAVLRAGNTNAGPRDFAMEYRIGNGNWTAVPNSNVVCNNAWTGGVYYNFSLPWYIEGQTDLVELRWIMTSDTSITGSPVQSAGVCKIDNIFVTGDITSGISEAGIQPSSVFPNPNNGHFTISCQADSRWQLINPMGQLVKEGFTREDRNIEISENPAGAYFLRVENRGKAEVVKIVKE